MGTYEFSGAPQFVTVAATGTYDIHAFGGQGGYSNPFQGGLGAEVGGTFTLTMGEKLEIIAGGKAGYEGGGGGSFVLANIGGTYTPLLIAAGGGGSRNTGAGGPGLVTTGNGQGGARGLGGYGGGGGSGVKSNGGNGSVYSYGGKNRTGVYAGGKGLFGDGGFGGGGGGDAGGGGGGGYSGGAGGYGKQGQDGQPGLGGTSFDSGNPVSSETTAGENSGNGRVIITPNAVCFASGTCIRTADGNVAVENLAIGDVVVTASGAQRPIRWLGHRTIDCRRHPRTVDVLPILISAHAFGTNRPVRDLFVSPGHSICVDVLGEILIPANALVNGSTIRQVEVNEVTYWHVEIDRHDILLAENLPAESYVDCGNRSFFAEAEVTFFQYRPRRTSGNDRRLLPPLPQWGRLGRRGAPTTAPACRDNGLGARSRSACQYAPPRRWQTHRATRAWSLGVRPRRSRHRHVPPAMG